MEEKKLTERQERFVNEYLVCGNGAEAARRAGYSLISARQRAYENVTKPDIQDAIRAKMDKAGIPEKTALKVLCKGLNANLVKVVSFEGKITDTKIFPDFKLGGQNMDPREEII